MQQNHVQVFYLLHIRASNDDALLRDLSEFPALKAGEAECRCALAVRRLHRSDNVRRIAAAAYAYHQITRLRPTLNLLGEDIRKVRIVCPGHDQWRAVGQANSFYRPSGFEMDALLKVIYNMRRRCGASTVSHQYHFTAG